MIVVVVVVEGYLFLMNIIDGDGGFPKNSGWCLCTCFTWLNRISGKIFQKRFDFNAGWVVQFSAPLTGRVWRESGDDFLRCQNRFFDPSRVCGDLSGRKVTTTTQKYRVLTFIRVGPDSTCFTRDLGSGLFLSHWPVFYGACDLNAAAEEF